MARKLRRNPRRSRRAKTARKQRWRRHEVKIHNKKWYAGYKRTQKRIGQRMRAYARKHPGMKYAMGSNPYYGPKDNIRAAFAWNGFGEYFIAKKKPGVYSVGIHRTNNKSMAAIRALSSHFGYSVKNVSGVGDNPQMYEVVSRKGRVN